MKPFPTFEECVEICEGETPFSQSTQEKNGVQIHSFKYHYSYSEMFEPFLERGINALALRGLTFIDGKVVAAGPDKFFNLNENQHSTYPEQVKLIMEKVDGSLIQVFKTPYGLEVKTQKSIYSDVAKDARVFFEARQDLKDFCSELVEKNWSPYFEYVSAKHRIVVDYPEENMTFLGMRNLETGEIKFPSETETPDSIPQVRTFTKQEADDYLTQSGVEGIVVVGDDNRMLKIKTQEYCQLHRMYDLYTYKHMCEYYQEHKSFDDVIAQLEQRSKSNDAQRLRDFETMYVEKYQEYLSPANDWVRKGGGMTQKEFAQYMKDNNVKGLTLAIAFALFNGKSFDFYIDKALHTHFRLKDKE